MWTASPTYALSRATLRTRIACVCCVAHLSAYVGNAVHTRWDTVYLFSDLRSIWTSSTTWLATNRTWKWNKWQNGILFGIFWKKALPNFYDMQVWKCAAVSSILVDRRLDDPHGLFSVAFDCRHQLGGIRQGKVSRSKRMKPTYTVSHRECGQFRPYIHENFEKFKIISTPTGSWWAFGAIESNCPSGSKLSWNFQNFSWT